MARSGRRIFPLAMSLGIAVGCELDLHEPELGVAGYEIVGGVATTGDPAVVLLDLGDGLCTGTVVSPRVVVTAAHCLLGPAESIDVHFVSRYGDPGPIVGVASYENHASADLGAVTLLDVADVTPVPTNTRGLEGAVGDEVRIVGFGVTGENAIDSGLKREGRAVLESITAEPPLILSGEMVTTNRPQGTCYGDSGGPNFMRFDEVEVLAGVTSRGTDTCGAGRDIAVRIDSHEAWLESFIDRNDPPDCGADGRCATGCPSLDLDCCVNDGVCVAECGERDPDCARSAGSPGRDLQGGCSASGTARGAWLLVALALLIRPRRMAALVVGAGALAFAVAGAACGGGDPDPEVNDRLVPPGDPAFDSLERPEAPGECEVDGDCEISCVHSCVPKTDGPVTCPNPPPPPPPRVADADCRCADTVCAYFE